MWGWRLETARHWWHRGGSEQKGYAPEHDSSIVDRTTFFEQTMEVERMESNAIV